jgi:hypothetical protein
LFDDRRECQADFIQSISDKMQDTQGPGLSRHGAGLATRLVLQGAITSRSTLAASRNPRVSSCRHRQELNKQNELRRNA